MIFKYWVVSIFALFLFCAVFVSCTDEWDNHYNDVSIEGKSNLNLYEYIKSKDNLTMFTKILENSGYDTIVSQPLSFTVWAPNDEALSGVDVSDNELAVKIAKNSIARYSYTTSGVDELSVRMLNSKLLLLEKDGSNYEFDSASISEPNLAVANGILHVTSQYVPYRMNLWEFINNNTGLDSLKQYANSLSKVVLDSASSYENGIFVDSIYKTSNALLDKLADLDVEDSIYTALLPDNSAWISAYNAISPFYNMTAADGGSAQQRTSTLWTLLSNLFYRGKIQNPASELSLTSTGHYTTYEPSSVFQNTEKHVLSNGLGFVTSEFNINDTASWNKPIKMEAEYSTYGRTLLNYTAVVQSGVGIGSPISNNSYLALTDASLSSASKLSVEFPIPYTLSTKYNIYCVFVPRKVLDSTSVLPYQVKFYLTYLNSSGVSTTMYVNSSNVAQSSSSALASFVTDPNQVDTMLVAKNVVLPYSNIIYNTDTNADFISDIHFSLKVENAASKTSKTYNRNIMIDCIILEPVKE